MVKLYNVDKLQLLKFGEFSSEKQTNIEPTAFIGAFLTDLIIENKIALKKQDDNKIILKAIDDQLLEDPFLNKIFLTIRDCPKIHSLQHWIRRFTDNYSSLSKSHFISLQGKNLIKRNHSRTIRIKIFVGLLLLPIFLIGLILLISIFTTPNYGIIDSNLQQSINDKLDEAVKPTSELNSEDMALIGIIKVTKMDVFPIGGEQYNQMMEKYYSLYDMEFNKPDVKLVLDYLTYLIGTKEYRSTSTTPDSKIFHEEAFSDEDFPNTDF